MDTITATIAALSPRDLNDVITGRTRIGTTQAEQLAAWNAAIDRDNGYDA